MRDIGPRLSALLALVAPGKPLFDVGCDHGLLAMAAVASGRVPAAVLIDRAAAALDRARADIATHLDAALAARLELVHADAAEIRRPVSGTVVIAGVGARAAERVLERWVLPAAAPATRLVLQPEVEGARLRAFLSARGLGPTAHEVHARGRTHAILVAQTAGGAP